jgi:hypothetical protein
MVVMAVAVMMPAPIAEVEAEARLVVTPNLPAMQMPAMSPALPNPADVLRYPIAGRRGSLNLCHRTQGRGLDGRRAQDERKCSNGSQKARLGVHRCLLEVWRRTRPQQASVANFGYSPALAWQRRCRLSGS